MRQSRYLWLGPVAFAWFFSWVALLDVLRPDYYFAHKAVSELGAIGAPHMWAMNLFGFVGTGVMLMLFARGYRAALPKRPAVPGALLLLTGLLFASTAVPMAMAPDGNPDLGAPITQLHLLISQLALLPWILVLLGTLTRHRDPSHRGLALISLLTILAFAVVIALFAMGIGVDTPGLMQRTWFAIFLGWFAAVGIWLAVLSARSPARGAAPRCGRQSWKGMPAWRCERRDR